MLLYRIAKCQYIHDLSGTGARLYGGRWNSLGKPAVYLASSRALAVLEVLVHLPPTLLPAGYCVITIEAPDDILKVDIKHLPKNWKEYPEPVQLKQLGDKFLKANKHLLLSVPSAIVKEENNYVLNPLHPLMAEVKITHQEDFNFDERLI
ncbi:RES family NAD+ phosphorylase [Mucilaginibacter koreensis]